MDLYFFPPLGVRREFADTLTFYADGNAHVSAAPAAIRASDTPRLSAFSIAVCRGSVIVAPR